LPSFAGDFRVGEPRSTVADIADASTAEIILSLTMLCKRAVSFLAVSLSEAKPELLRVLA
jgi:hypothetical protein